MPIKMKKLISSGIPGANEGYVMRGREFEAANEQRAKELEDAGLAYRLPEAKMQPAAPLNKMEPAAPANKAADTGPLGSHGGETGEEEPAPSSHPDHQPRGRRSGRSKGKDLLS